MTVLVTPAFAQHAKRDDPRRAAVAAATENAIDSLREQILAKQLKRNVSVKSFLDQTAGHDELNKLLGRAQLIGGPRQIDEDGTTQVRLEISGVRVARALLQIASGKPDWSPIKPDELAVELTDWNKITFSSVGTSTGAAAAVNARPPPGEQATAWKNIDEETRRNAIAQAKADAVARVIASIQTIEMSAADTVGDVLKSDPKAREELENWLAARPVTKIDFRDDRSVEVTLAATPEETFDAFRAHLAIGDKFDWRTVREQWLDRMAAPVGVASAQPRPRDEIVLASTKPRVANLVILPALAPDWVNKEIEAEGAAAAQSTKLKTARRAEINAADKLREQIASLPLTRDLTIGAASKEDVRIADAVDRVLNENAYTAESKYLPDGSATVRVVLSLRDLWDELRRAQ